MKTYTVRAVRWDRGWELHIPDVGVTQAHNLREAPHMAADYIEMRTGVPAAEVHLDMRYEVDDEAATAAQRARLATEAAEHARDEAAAQSRAAVRKLIDAGLSQADSAVYLGITPGRISQLLNA